MPMTDAHELAGKSAVVTGSSSGIGRAIALELAAAGANVFVHAGRNREGVENVAQKVHDLGVDCCLTVADLADVSSYDSLISEAWNWHQNINIWMNIAGADVLTGVASKLTFAEKMERLWAVDVRATIELSRRAGQRMKQQNGPPGGCVIVNMGWDRAATGMEGDSGEMFSATKGAVMAFTRSLAKSLAPEVRVNCLAPGWIKTAWGQQASEAWQQRAVQESGLGRWGTPEDVAHTARFLASSASAFITGQVIAVNGGTSDDV